MLHNSQSETPDEIDEVIKRGRDLFTKLIDSKIQISSIAFANELETVISSYQKIPKTKRTAKCYDLLLLVLWIMTVVANHPDGLSYAMNLKQFIVSDFESKPPHLATSVNGKIPYLLCLSLELTNHDRDLSAPALERQLYANLKAAKNIQELLKSLPDIKIILDQYGDDKLLKVSTIHALAKTYLMMILFWGQIGDNTKVYDIAERFGDLFFNYEDLMIDENLTTANEYFNRYYTYMAEVIDNIPLLSKLFKFTKKLFEPTAPILLKDLISICHDFMKTITPMQVDLYHHLLLVFKIIENDIKAGAFDKTNARLITNNAFRELMQIPDARDELKRHKEMLDKNRLGISQLNNNSHLMAANILEVQSLRAEVNALRSELSHRHHADTEKKGTGRGSKPGMFN